MHVRWMLLVVATGLALQVAGCQSGPRPQREEVRTDQGLAALYVWSTYDPEKHRETCKVWHEVYAPDGRLLTKGLGGEFEHHRGLFFGHNQVRSDKRSFDFWHCQGGVSQRHMGFVDPETIDGLEGNWQVAQVDWCDADGKAIVRELRGLTAVAESPDRTRIEVVIELNAVGGKVRLGGDPQHSGHQFRALNAFARPNAEPLRYVRPASASGGTNDVWTDCDWIAGVLPLPDGPVTVIRVEKPGNPAPVRWSTRPYGRFGATFSCVLIPDQPLRISYSYIIATGELTAERCQQLANAAR